MDYFMTIKPHLYMSALVKLLWRLSNYFTSICEINKEYNLAT